MDSRVSERCIYDFRCLLAPAFFFLLLLLLVAVVEDTPQMWFICILLLLREWANVVRRVLRTHDGPKNHMSCYLYKPFLVLITTLPRDSSLWSQERTKKRPVGNKSKTMRAPQQYQLQH